MTTWSEIHPRTQAAAEPARQAVKEGKSVLFVGPPGAGKTMVARRLAPAPPQQDDQTMMQIYRLAGLTLPSSIMRPFRAPHHTCSAPGILGNGRQMRPGEASLAHGGILFLDEAPEFQRHVLEAIANAYKHKLIEYPGAPHLKSLPADFALVGAMCPCPCGPVGRGCTCTTPQVHRYEERIAPLNFDIVVHLPKLTNAELLEHRGAA